MLIALGWIDRRGYSGRFEAKWLLAFALVGVLAVVTYGISHLWPAVSPTLLIIAALVVTLAFCPILQLRYALAAIVALFHDVLVTVGFFRSLTRISTCRLWPRC